MRLLLSLALRNLLRHRARTALALAAIVLGVVALILSGGFVQDVFVQLREVTIHSQVGHLQLFRSGYYLEGRRDPYRYVIRGSEQLADSLRGSHGVTDVTRRVYLSALANNGRADLPILGEGIEPGKEARVGSLLTIVDGRPLQDSDTSGALVGRGVARALQLKAGDRITVLANTPDGALNTIDVEVVGVFQSFARDYDDRVVRLPLAAAQELLGVDAVHSLVFLLGRSDDTDWAKSVLEQQLAGQGYEVKAWHELADFYRKTVDLYERQLGVLQIIILLMVLLSVLNATNMAIFERTAEFGTMRALGNRGWQVFAMIVTEIALLGLLGALIGVGLGLLLAGIASAVGIPMPPPPNADIGYIARIRVTPSILVNAFLVGVLAAVLASVAPALRVARTQVVEALRQNV
jgi:putative ABC transport system permease protein